jgi:hypothetical protein
MNARLMSLHAPLGSAHVPVSGTVGTGSGDAPRPRRNRPAR